MSPIRLSIWRLPVQCAGLKGQIGKLETWARQTPPVIRYAEAQKAFNPSAGPRKGEASDQAGSAKAASQTPESAKEAG